MMATLASQLTHSPNSTSSNGARKLGLEVAVAKCQYSNYDRASKHNCAYEGELNDCFPIDVARDVRQSFHEFSPDVAIVCDVD
jgi:hypothetical protein